MRYQRYMLVAMSLAVTAAGQTDTKQSDPSPMDRKFESASMSAFRWGKQGTALICVAFPNDSRPSC